MLRVLALLFVLICGSALWSNAGKPPIAPPEAGLFWKIERVGVPPSYLFGTMHVAHPDALAVAAIAERQLEYSRILVAEVDLLARPSSALAARQFLPPDLRLSDLLPPALHSRTLQLAERAYGLDVKMVDRMQPWVLADLFMRNPRDVGTQDGAPPMMDVRLQQLAREQGIPVLGLETAAELASYFAVLSIDQQVRFLETSLRWFSQLESMEATWVAQFRGADLRAMERSHSVALLGCPAWYCSLWKDQLTVGRNYLMAWRMQDALLDGEALVAVGALHLAGEEGLIVLLQRLGWTVTRAD